VEKKIGKTFEGSLDKFGQKVDNVRERVDALWQRVGESSPRAKGMTSEALEGLNNALEELNVAEEELRAQNEDLVIARAKLEAERQRYLDLFEFAPDGYLVTDEVGKIREANRAAATLLNVSQKFLIGKPLVNFIPYEERRTFRSKLNQLRQTDWMQEWELSLCPRDRATFDAALTASTVRDWEGKPTGWRWLLRDITARKQAEEKIRKIQLQNLQLQEVARQKSHFLAIMSHELRSPMNAIIGFSQLLLRYPCDSLAPKQENMVERILKSAMHLLTLIEDILDFSKLEADGFELKLEEFNLAELVTATSEEMRSLIEQKNLTMQVHLNLQNPRIVNDSTRLWQILVNLLSNAIKFTDSGSVLLEVWELPTDRIAIALKDTGIGIAEAEVAHIFDEFRQVNQTITRKHGGTGLGLAITDRLVRIMQGTITVESELGQGSTFRVELRRRVRRESRVGTAHH
jgi:PAS domain S-box-containing protein